MGTKNNVVSGVAEEISNKKRLEEVKIFKSFFVFL